MPDWNGHTVYCAGPMFSPGDLGEMEQIKDVLEGAGYQTYLPQRDGIEVAEVMKGIDGKEGATIQVDEKLKELVTDLMRKAVFSLDVFQLLSRCDCVVFNMNGRVPDDGGIAETSMAFAAGKPVVIYKDDPITILMGLDNPLVQGLSYTWDYAESYDAIAPKVTAFLKQYEQLWGPPASPKLSAFLSKVVALGEQVWTELSTLRSQSPNDPTKVTYGVIGWLVVGKDGNGKDIKAAFADTFPTATASS